MGTGYPIKSITSRSGGQAQKVTRTSPPLPSGNTGLGNQNNDRDFEENDGNKHWNLQQAVDTDHIVSKNVGKIKQIHEMKASLNKHGRVL